MDRCSKAMTFLFGLMRSIVSWDNPVGELNMSCRLLVETWIKDRVTNHRPIEIVCHTGVERDELS